MSREMSCGYCREYGHNRVTCKKLLDKAHMVEAALIEGDYESLIQFTRDPGSRFSSSHESRNKKEAISWSDTEAYREVMERKQKQEQAKARARTCGYCRQVGHNRRTCETKKVRNVEQAKAKSYTHRFVASILRASGCLPGALLSTQVTLYDNNYNKTQDAEMFGLITGIDWSQVGDYDPNRQPYPRASIAADLCHRDQLLNVLWIMPPMTENSKLHYRVSPLSTLPSNVLLEVPSPWAQGHALKSPLTDCDDYEFHEADYLGNDSEGCPDDFTLHLDAYCTRSEKSLDFFRSAGVVLKDSEFDDGPMRILSFNERGR